MSKSGFWTSSMKPTNGSEQRRFVLKRQEQWITKSGVDVCRESSAGIFEKPISSTMSTKYLFFRNPYSRFAARWSGQSFFSLLTCPLSLHGHQQKLKKKSQNLPYTSLMRVHWIVELHVHPWISPRKIQVILLEVPYCYSLLVSGCVTSSWQIWEVQAHWLQFKSR